MSRDELTKFIVGYGHKPYFVEGDDPTEMHGKDGGNAGMTRFG